MIGWWKTSLNATIPKVATVLLWMLWSGFRPLITSERSTLLTDSSGSPTPHLWVSLGKQGGGNSPLRSLETRRLGSGPHQFWDSGKLAQFSPKETWKLSENCVSLGRSHPANSDCPFLLSHHAFGSSYATPVLGEKLERAATCHSAELTSTPSRWPFWNGACADSCDPSGVFSSKIIVQFSDSAYNPVKDSLLVKYAVGKKVLESPQH